MRSLSLSGSGQPSASWKPSLSSGSLGQLSSTSWMPSLSLSGSGQPSASWKPSLSSGSSGHLSFESGMPSPSRSPSTGGGGGGGAPATFFSGGGGGSGWGSAGSPNEGSQMKPTVPRPCAVWKPGK